IAKVAGSASNANRCSPRMAWRCEPEQIMLPCAEPENLTAPGIGLDLRGSEALRFQKLQTLALPRHLLASRPGLDNLPCGLQDVQKLARATKISSSSESSPQTAAADTHSFAEMRPGPHTAGRR